MRNNHPERTVGLEKAHTGITRSKQESAVMLQMCTPVLPDATRVPATRSMETGT